MTGRNAGDGDIIDPRRRYHQLEAKSSMGEKEKISTFFSISRKKYH